MPAMWPETKQAVRKALWVCELLLGLPNEDYHRLIEATSKIRCPLRNEIRDGVKDSLGDEMLDSEELEMMVDEVMVDELKRRYEHTAVSIGLTPDHGSAMLEYVVLLKDVGDE